MEPTSTITKRPKNRTNRRRKRQAQHSHRDTATPTSGASSWPSSLAAFRPLQSDLLPSLPSLSPASWAFLLGSFLHRRSSVSALLGASSSSCHTLSLPLSTSFLGRFLCLRPSLPCLGLASWVLFFSLLPSPSPHILTLLRASFLGRLLLSSFLRCRSLVAALLCFP